MTIPDYAARRQPQRIRFGAAPTDYLCTAPLRVCPLRPEDGPRLLPDEIPHATTWLAVRRNTARMLGVRGDGYGGHAVGARYWLSRGGAHGAVRAADRPYPQRYTPPTIWREMMALGFNGRMGKWSCSSYTEAEAMAAIAVPT